MTNWTGTRALKGLAVALGSVAAISSSAAAQSAEEFYKGKSLDLLVGASPGGGYATYAQALSRHFGKHVPGKPNIVAKSMPGAGGVRATQVLYSRSPRDGTALAAVFMGTITEPLVGDKLLGFDATKLIYIGSLNQETSLCMAWHTTPVQSFGDLFEKEMVVGASGWTASIRQYPAVLHNILGAKLKVIHGYEGSAAARLAMERGETGGFCGIQWSSTKTQMSQWLEEGKIRLLVQLAPKPHPELQARGVPIIWDFVKDKKDEEALRLMFGQTTFGRPYILPPGVPADRVKALRTAFMEMTRDPEFLAEAERAKIGIDAVSGEEVTKAVEEIYKSDPAVVARVKEALSKK